MSRHALRASSSPSNGLQSTAPRPYDAAKWEKHVLQKYLSISEKTQLTFVRQHLDSLINQNKWAGAKKDDADYRLNMYSSAFKALWTERGERKWEKYCSDIIGCGKSYTLLRALTEMLDRSVKRHPKEIRPSHRLAIRTAFEEAHCKIRSYQDAGWRPPALKGVQASQPLDTSRLMLRFGNQSG